MVENASNSACPSPAVLARYASAGTHPREVAEHVARCEICQARLEELAQDELLVGRLHDALGLEGQTTLRQSLQAATAGDYEILEPLGRGTHGIVFKARDPKLGRLVAIKCLARRDAPAALLQEARNLARINHPGIAAIYAVCPTPELPYIVMELVEGRPLTEALRDAPLLEQTRAFSRALQAVAELHRHGLIHRDLKPENILVDGRGNVKVLDLGITHASDMAVSGCVEGTPAYLAPEQSYGQAARPTADVFSLGIVLFELLTQQRPFRGATPAQVITAIRQDDPPLPRSLRSEIPGALQAICLTALEKDPAQRYPSAGQFLLDVERFLRGEAVSANPTLLASALEHGIERHITDLERWSSDRLISTREHDYLLNQYDRLRQREEFWVLDSRRISFSQVLLHLGVWACVVSAFLMLAFPWSHLGGERLLLSWALLPGLLYGGWRLWQKRTFRVASVLLIGAATLCPLAVATGLVHFHVWPGSPAEDLLPEIVSNQQLLAAAICGLAISLILWRHTRTAAFSLISGLMELAVATAAFGELGLRAQLDANRPDIVAGWYLGVGAALFVAAMAWDLRARIPAFAAPLYVMGMAILLGTSHGFRCPGTTGPVQLRRQRHPVLAGWKPGQSLITEFVTAADRHLAVLAGPFAHPDPDPASGRPMAAAGLLVDGAGTAAANWRPRIHLPKRAAADEELLLLGPLVPGDLRAAADGEALRGCLRLAGRVGGQRHRAGSGGMAIPAAL